MRSGCEVALDEPERDQGDDLDTHHADEVSPETASAFFGVNGLCHGANLVVGGSAGYDARMTLASILVL
jgi:hypothetical protein